jgi:hypothetical protein
MLHLMRSDWDLSAGRLTVSGTWRGAATHHHPAVQITVSPELTIEVRDEAGY